MEYDSHILSKYLIFQMFKFQSKYLAFSSKTLIYYVFQFINFEMLGFSHLELEILGISSKIPSISQVV